MFILTRLYNYCYYLSQKIIIETMIFVEEWIINNLHGTNPDNRLGR